MAVHVEMPKLGNTVEECVISKWLKTTGDSISAEEAVVEIETDKASFEVVSPVGGTLLARFFDEGTLVPVYTALFVVGDPGEDVEAFRPVAESSAPASNAVSAASDAQPARRPEHVSPAVFSYSDAPMKLSPRARRYSEEHRVYPGTVHGSGPGGRLLEADLREAYHTPPQLARQRGPVEDTVPHRREVPVVPALPVESLPGEPISGLREKVARRMRESLSTTAQYTLNSSADARGMLALRARAKASASSDLNINDLVMFCTVQALVEVQELNQLFSNGRLQRNREVHLGFACDTARGLLVPVVHNAQELSPVQLSARVRELSAQATEGKIAPDNLTGATFTVSNLGALGIESFTPLLNPPQVAILGVSAIQLKPVRGVNGIEFIESIGLSLTLDHQIIDGAPGARFLKVLSGKIANVEQLCTI